MQQLADSAGVALRPHAKTHKSPVIARWQLDRGAVGICCAKVGEAEVFADAGIRDIRLPYPDQPDNAARVLALDGSRGDLDRRRSPGRRARQWSEAMRAARRTLDVLVKVDVGFHRCGIDPDARSDRFHSAGGVDARVARARTAEPRGPRLPRGVDDRAGAIARRESEMLRSLRAAGGRGRRRARRDRRSAPPRRFGSAPANAGLTELRPGNYVYFDRTQVAIGVGDARGLRADGARHGRVQAVGRSHHPRLRQQDAVERSGAGQPPGYGAVLTDDGSAIDATLTIERLSEEHATVKVRGSDGARTWRSRPRAAQSFLRRVEPGRRDPAGRGQIT